MDALNNNFMNLGARDVYIPSNADLDTYRAPGIYDCNSASVAVTLKHCPVITGFRLIVETAGYGFMAYGFQTILLGSGAETLSVGGRVYRRVINGPSPETSAWGEWKELPTRAEIDALNSSFRRYVVSVGEKTYEIGAVSFVFIGQSSNSARIFMYSNSMITNLAGSSDTDVVVSSVDATHITITNNHTWNLRMLVLGMN
jgi:hypothetical protein